MRSSPLLLLALTTTSVFVEIGCSGNSDADRVGTADQASTASDLALAREILTLVGGQTGKCAGCHTASPEDIRGWGTAMKTIEDACFAPSNLTAKQRVDCLRTTPTDPASSFGATKLGFYAAGASFGQTRDVFKAAFPAAEWTARWEAYTRQVGMPRGRAPIAEADFTKVKAWMLRGMPQLNEATAGGNGGGGLVGCVDSTTPELATHLSTMRTQGWGARLADQSTVMFGCGAANNPLACLTSLPDIGTQVGAAGVTQKVRKLRQQPLASHYWVRSSADGRYVGFGFNDSSRIIDLTKPETAAPINVAADYDPFFLPSNDGFSFAGAHSDSSLRLCRQSLLSDVSGQAAPAITLLEPKCARIGDDVYQSIGSALDGARYFVTVGAHENDDGGNDITAPLPANFGPRSITSFTPMVSNGASFRAEPTVQVVLPGEGDVVLSPSSRLFIDRFTGGTKQGGYRIRAVDSRSTGAAVAIQTPLRAEICLKGGKATFSFDERFVATHQYVDRTEADQASLPQGSANIVVADLATGRKVRLTNMAAGQYALYPHYRADGWLYFLVRDMNTNVEYVAATDATLRLAAQ